MEKDIVQIPCCFTEGKSCSLGLILNGKQLDSHKFQHNEQPFRDNANNSKDPTNQHQNAKIQNENSIGIQVSGPKMNLENLNNINKIQKNIDEKCKYTNVDNSNKLRHFSNLYDKITFNNKYAEPTQLSKWKKLLSQSERSRQEKLIRHRVRAINKEIKSVFDQILAFNMSRKVDKLLQTQQEIIFKKKILQIQAQKAVKIQEFSQDEDTKELEQNRQALKKQRKRQQQEKMKYLMGRINQLQKSLKQQEKKSQDLCKRSRRDSSGPFQEIIMEENQGVEDEQIQKVEQQL